MGSLELDIEAMKLLLIVLFAHSALSTAPSCLNGTKIEEKWEKAYSRCSTSGRSICEELNTAYGIDVDECESSFASATGRSLTQLCADLNAFFGISVSTCTSSCTYYSTGASCDFTGRNACPSPKDIIKDARENFQVERCMMSAMGWFNPKKSSFNKKLIKKDIGSLPDKVSAGITKKSVKKCIMKKMEEMYKKDTMNCLKTYTKKQRAMLKKEAYVVATIYCLTNPLKEACDNFY